MGENEIIKQTEKTFEEIKHIDENENEYWYARELMVALGYKSWRYFEIVIEKSKISCKTRNISAIDHFVASNKMVNWLWSSNMIFIKRYSIERNLIMNKEIHENMIEIETLLQSINNTDSVEFSKWTKEKANLKYNEKVPKFPIYNNFIYWCNLGINIGSEQNKIRPVLIIKTTKNSTICAVLPLTSKRLDDGFWFHIDLEKIESTVLIEQLRVISKLRIVNPYRKRGKLVAISKNDWSRINMQLENLYRLKPLKS